MPCGCRKKKKMSALGSSDDAGCMAVIGDGLGGALGCVCGRWPGA